MPVDPSPAASGIAKDDTVVVFRTQTSDVRGRLVRLGRTLDAIVAPHNMPDAAGQAMSEALALAALCGSALPAEGNLNLQTRSDGGVSILVADYAATGRLRGYARCDTAKLAEREELKLRRDAGDVLGTGHLAITLDPGPGEERYQGILAFEDAPLAATAAAYFEQREALPTFIRLSVARHYVARHYVAAHQTSQEARWHWRAGGLMVQSLAAASPERDADASEDWQRVKMLATTVEDHELLDPELTAQRLLLRLFHEEAVTIERVIPLSQFCRCSREKVENVLRAFGANELADMRDDSGQIVVTCEFCTARYLFSLYDLREPGG
jgi:molecular chaperone Hsp33